MLQKYFIAIVPPKNILDEINEIKNQIFDNYKTKGALKSPAHITLHMPFSWDDDKEHKLISSIDVFKYDKKFNIQLNNFSCFEPRVVFIDVIQNSDLFELQTKLVKHAKVNLQLFNQSDDMRGFHPHVTIAFRDLKKPVFYKVWEEYKQKMYHQEFSVESISLLKLVDGKWINYKEFIL